MVIDPSALLQILLGEPGAADTLRLLLATDDAVVTAPGLLEAEVAFAARSGLPGATVERLVERLGARVVPVGPEHVAEARRAFERFGAPSGHPAQLSVSDCVHYAVARVEGRALAFTGDRFVHTDLDQMRTG